MERIEPNYPMGKSEDDEKVVGWPELVLRGSVRVDEWANNKWAEENVADLLQSE